MARKSEDALLSAHAVLAALSSSIRVLRWAMLALVLIYLTSGITFIGPNEVGLVLRFGKVLPEIHHPGLLFALPRPADEVVKIPAKMVQEISLDGWAPQEGEDPSARTLNPISSPYTMTGDVNIIRAKFFVRYQVSDPIAYEFAAKDRDQLFRAVMYEAACQTLAGMSVDDVLTTRHDYVAQETMHLAQDKLDHLGLGIQLIAFETQEINPPAQVLPAFEDVVSARVQEKTLVEPANAYRASALPKSQSDAYGIKQEATAGAQQLVAQAQGEAASFVALDEQYRKNPERVGRRLYFDMLAEILPNLRLVTVMPATKGDVQILLAPRQAGGTVNPSPAQPSQSAETTSEANAQPPSGSNSVPDSPAATSTPSSDPAVPELNFGESNQSPAPSELNSNVNNPTVSPPASSPPAPGPNDDN